MQPTPQNHRAVGESQMLVGKHVEYRVRPITRYVVTRFEKDVDETGRSVGGGTGNGAGAEYGNYGTAFAVAYALAKAEHERLGYPICDPRIQYPREDMGEVSEAMASSQVGDIWP